MILDRFRLDGRVAVVTGAGRGLGRAMALALAAAGADIVAAARTAAQLEETARAVEALGRRCLVVPTDVTQPEQVNRLVRSAVEGLGAVDILVNNAGGGTAGMGKPIQEITDEEWRLGIDTNLSSVFYCCRAVVPHMQERGRGKIINVASGYGLRGGRHNYMYASAKAGVVNFTRSLALTLARDNIQVTCIAPGFFPHSEQAGQRIRGGAYIPVGRPGRDEEIGPLAVYLASDASNYLTGETIVLDGGGLAGGVTPTGWAPRVGLEG